MLLCFKGVIHTRSIHTAVLKASGVRPEERLTQLTRQDLQWDTSCVIEGVARLWCQDAWRHDSAMEPVGFRTLKQNRGEISAA